ncbi:MAG TPA: hypothetical protein PLQ96_06030 [Bacillota bacterium]|nr:hypothetical protein [Bacillota bacterium]
MKNVAAIFLAIVMCIGVSGCVSPTGPDDGSLVGEDMIGAVAIIRADFEDISWGVVSIDPKDYGITDDQLRCVSMPDFSEYILGELIAYYLYTDGAGSEGSAEVLYERFMEAPNTVLTYMALIGDQKARGGSSGNDTAVDELCRAIASADVAWHDVTDEFSEILAKYQSIYPDGRIAGILSRLEKEREAAIERNR